MKNIPVVLDDVTTDKWFNSKDAKAVKVRQRIIKGVYNCRNFGYRTDIEYLKDTKILLEAIKHCKFNYTDAENFE